MNLNYRRLSVIGALALLAIATTAHADPPEDVLRPQAKEQQKFFIEVGLGLNYSMMNGTFRKVEPYEGPTDMFASADGLGILLSISPAYQVTSNFQVLLRYDFDVRSVGNSATTTDYCTDSPTTDSVSVDKTYGATMTYNSVSLLGRYYLDQFFVFGGLTYGNESSTSVTGEQNIDPTAGCFYFPNNPDATTDIVADESNVLLHNDRWSIKLGVGYVFNVTPRISLLPQLNYDVALNHVGQGILNFRPKDNPQSANSTAFVVNPNNDLSLNSLQFLLGIRYNWSIEL